jgi:hypothetical protein
MITICIDPGTGHNCGGAVFRGTRLVLARLLDGARPDMAEVALTATDDYELSRAVELVSRVVVLEVPRVYPHSRAKADPNDLIKLAVAGARIAQVIAGHGNVLCIAPSDWKAQTDPDIMCERVLAKLDDAERGIVEAVFAAHGKKGMPKSLRHNVLDAIGIGLWRTGRMRPGGAGR